MMIKTKTKKKRKNKNKEIRKKEEGLPALSQMLWQGTRMALRTILTPTDWSKFSVLTSPSDCEAYNKAVPPPGKIPSSTAACFFLKKRKTKNLNTKKKKKKKKWKGVRNGELN